MSGSTFPAFASVRRLPNLFDVAAILCIGGLLFAIAGGARAPLPLRTQNSGVARMRPPPRRARARRR